MSPLNWRRAFLLHHQIPPPSIRTPYWQIPPILWMDLAAVSMSPLHFDRILGIERLTPSHLVVSKLPKFRINLSWKPKKNPGLQPQKRMAPTKVRKRKRYLRIVAQAMLIGQVEDFPKGFPKVSCFVDSDDAFMVYRRFGTVFARLLLSKQDEIRRLEAKLQGMDKTDERSGDSEYLMSMQKTAHGILPRFPLAGDIRQEHSWCLGWKNLYLNTVRSWKHCSNISPLISHSKTSSQSWLNESSQSTVIERLLERATLHGEWRWTAAWSRKQLHLWKNKILWHCVLAENMLGSIICSSKSCDCAAIGSPW